MSVTASRDLSFIEDENDKMYEICEKDRNTPFLPKWAALLGLSHKPNEAFPGPD